MFVWVPGSAGSSDSESTDKSMKADEDAIGDETEKRPLPAVDEFVGRNDARGLEKLNLEDQRFFDFFSRIVLLLDIAGLTKDASAKDPLILLTVGLLFFTVKNLSTARSKVLPDEFLCNAAFLASSCIVFEVCCTRCILRFAFCDSASALLTSLDFFCASLYVYFCCSSRSLKRSILPRAQ